MGILEDLKNEMTFEEEVVINDTALEAELILTAIRSECSTDEEFVGLLEAAGIEMSLHGVVEDHQMVLEAAKKFTVENFKEANFNRIAKRAAIRISEIEGDNEYKLYKKYRTLMIQAREKIYKKRGNQAKAEARRIIANGKTKASGMSSSAGKSITDKMDKVIANVNKN